jgi:hypothetical protein
LAVVVDDAVLEQILGLAVARTGRAKSAPSAK